jgi:hypothetical protein
MLRLQIAWHEMTVKNNFEQCKPADLIYLVSFSDIATVVGYLVVSRPFLDLVHDRHMTSTHSERLEVSYFA